MTDDQPLFTLADAHALARLAHEGQTDKLGVAYIEHVEAVAAGLVDFDLDIQIAGMLHDIVEDCDITLDDLRQRGVSERSLAAIELVSRNLHPELSYAEAIRLVTGSPDATLVKISDNAHNSRPDRVEALQRLTGRPVDTRYAEARVVLYEVAPPAAVAQILSRVAPSLLPERPPAQVDRLRIETWALATSAGRKPGTAGHDAARAYLEGRFDGLGLANYPGLDGFRHEYRAWDGIVMTNLLGILPGNDRSLAPILLGAHYDSVIEAPCADDNAAAVAVMLEVAARVTREPLSRDVIVVAFDAEEPPYFLGDDMGSNRLVAEVLHRQVHLAVVLDLVGHPVQIPGVPVDPHLMFITGAESHPALPGVLTGLDLPIVAVAQARVGDYSDYAAFRSAGAPYLFFSGGEWPHYHRASDRPELMDYPRMARLAADLERVLRGADVVDTAYDATTSQTEFEVATMEQAIGPEVLTAIARALGRPGYATAADLDAIVGGLRALVQ